MKNLVLNNKFILVTISFLVIAFVLFMPDTSFAQGGLVTCSGPDCDFCKLTGMIEKIGQFITGILVIISVVMLAVTGIQMAYAAAGGSDARQILKDRLTNIIIGFFLIIASWTLIDTLFKALVSDDQLRNSWRTPVAELCFQQNFSAEGTGDSYETYYGSGFSTSTLANIGIGSGNTAVPAFASQMKNKNCIYSQSRRNGCKTNPGYTDCSDLVNVAYRAAGCRSPGNTTAGMYPHAGAIGNPSTLRPGDAIVRRSGGRGHVVICQNNGCSSVIHASGKKSNIKVSNGSYYLHQPGSRVIRASDYCS